jgi:hypothetical protein
MTDYNITLDYLLKTMIDFIVYWCISIVINSIDCIDKLKDNKVI